MRKYWIMLALCLAACCGGAELKPFHGDNYILDCRSGIAISVKQKNGDFAPFLSGIGFDATDKDWKTFFRSAGFRAECVKQTPESALYRFEYRFTGPDAKRIRLGGTLEAHPDYMRIYFEGNFRGDTDKFFRRRILFRYPKEELRLLGAAADNGPEGGQSGIRLESSPQLRLFYNRKEKNSTGSQIWTGRDEERFFRLEITLEPYSGRIPEFSRLSKEPYEARFDFRRYCNVLLDEDERTAELKVLNRSAEPLDREARLTIRDHRGRNLETRKLRIEAAPGKTVSQAVPLPSGRYGWFELEFDLPGSAPFRRSCCILPPAGRKFGKGSIFGGIIYPWNRKTVEKLDLMHWIGMSTIRRAYPIAREGSSLPAGPEYTPDEAALVLREQAARGIEPVPLTSESWNYPAGTFRLTESSNEANIRRLPVDYAEELKIEYVRTKLHDPELQVGSTGTAGIDLHWFEELQENGAWDYFDALFVHLHCFPRAPEVNNTMTREFWLHDRVTLLRELMDKYGEKPVYDSENGYLTRFPDRRVEKYPLRSVSDSSIAAAFMVRSYLQCLAYGVSNKMWFTVDSYGGFGITEYGQPLPAYPAYAAMTRMLDGARYAGELLSPGRVSNAMDRNAEFSRSWFGQATPGLEKELLGADRDYTENDRNPELKPYVYIRAFRTPDGRPLLACWATLYRQKLVDTSIDTPAWQDQKPGISLLWNGFPATEPPKPLPVRFRVGVPEVEVADLMGNRRKVAADNGFLTLALDDYPQFVFGADPALLGEAEQFSLRLFPETFRKNDRWKTLVQAVLPAEKKHPARKSVFDRENLSAGLEAGKPYPIHVRLTNLGKEAESGTISLKLPERWRCEPGSIRFEAAAGAEKTVAATFLVTPDRPAAKVKIRSIVQSDRLGRIADSVMNVGVK